MTYILVVIIYIQYNVSRNTHLYIISIYYKFLSLLRIYDTDTTISQALYANQYLEITYIIHRFIVLYNYTVSLFLFYYYFLLYKYL